MFKKKKEHSKRLKPKDSLNEDF